MDEHDTEGCLEESCAQQVYHIASLMGSYAVVNRVISITNSRLFSSTDNEKAIQKHLWPHYLVQYLQKFSLLVPLLVTAKEVAHSSCHTWLLNAQKRQKDKNL